jgi:hypothetical protein
MVALAMSTILVGGSWPLEGLIIGFISNYYTNNGHTLMFSIHGGG